MKRIFSGSRYANVTASLALVLALGGTSYAAIKLPTNSVGNKQLKANAVTSGKVKNGTLLSTDFKAGQIPAGPRGAAGAAGATGVAGAKGDKGDKGDAGAPGEAVAFANVLSNGTLQTGAAANASKSITNANITHPAAGVYCFGNLPFTPRSAVATVEGSFGDSNDAIINVSVYPAGVLGNCGAADTVRVDITDLNGAEATVATNALALAKTNHRFVIWFE